MKRDGNDLEVVWAVLEAQGEDVVGLRVRGTGVMLPAGEVLVASGPDGHRHALFPLAEQTAFAEDTATRGVQIRRRRLDTGDGISDFADVECRMSHLNSVFATLAEEMLRAVGADPDRPAVVCRAVLDRWREFLGAERSPLLSEEATVGLLAELLVLLNVLEHDLDRRLDVWAGPSGAVHDFRRGETAVEVKGTLIREGRFVQVHGVEQLLPPPTGSLHLAFYRFEPDDSSAISVPAAIRKIRALGVDGLAFNELLSLAGYDTGHSEDYEQRRYRVVDDRFYCVDAAFPRIVPAYFTGGAVPPGVLRLRYTVDLTNEPPVPVDRVARDSVLRKIGTS